MSEEQAVRMPGDIAPPVVFSPARWRTTTCIVALPVMAAIVLLCALLIGGTPLWWLALASCPLWLPTLWYTGGMTRRVVVRPGVAIERRRLFGGIQSVPVDATTEIVTFPDTIKTRGLPGTALESKWFVVRSQGHAAMRLSGQYWSLAEITDLARAAPTRLRIRAEPTPVENILAEYPDHFARIEHHPALMTWGILLMLLGTVPLVMAVFVGVPALLTIGPRLLFP